MVLNEFRESNNRQIVNFQVQYLVKKLLTLFEIFITFACLSFLIGVHILTIYLKRF